MKSEGQVTFMHVAETLKSKELSDRLGNIMYKQNVDIDVEETVKKSFKEKKIVLIPHIFDETKQKVYNSIIEDIVRNIVGNLRNGGKALSKEAVSKEITPDLVSECVARGLKKIPQIA